MIEGLVFLGKLKRAAEDHAHIGCNTDVRQCARRFGLPEDEKVLHAIKALAAPGVLRREFTFDEWLRFWELWEQHKGRA